MDRGRTVRSTSRLPRKAWLTELASRLTPRDRRLCRLVHDHTVLTAHQLAQVAFGSLDRAEHRCRELTHLEVLDRFRPINLTQTGSYPYHYTLGPAGAAILAAENNQTMAQFGYRRDLAQSVAHNQNLNHLIGCNGFFTALIAHARRHPETELTDWWSERRTAAAVGAVVRPDGYGAWRHGQTNVSFYLEHDNGTEATRRVADKLPGYARLFRAQSAWRPVLLWLPTGGRERAVRRAIPPGDVPVATAARDRNPDPAGPVWAPITAPDHAPRVRLAGLADPAVWRHTPEPRLW